MQANDPRHLSRGLDIPNESYCDQPYVVKTDDGAWLCIITTGQGREGQPGQHLIAQRSTDQGQTWEAPVDVEPADGPEASYAVLQKMPGGRVYCFYNYNTQNMREVVADDPPFKGGLCKRVDSLGDFVFKYSDDHGRTWSSKRHNIPVREFVIDRENAYEGSVRFFWNVGKPFIHDGALYVSLHKVGGFGYGFFTRSEGVLLRSKTILTESDPEQIQWDTLPDGEVGLRTPTGGGPIAEEHSYCVLSDGSFFSVYRTIDGYPVSAYSRDAGRTWSEPAYMKFANGQLVKHPRAANFAWRCENGKYLYWFHNHGGRFVGQAHPDWKPYEDRNPVWLCGGIEVDSPDGKILAWSEPEIALYDDDPYLRISYPDLIEEPGKYFLTETQKTIARVHEIDTTLIEGLWAQFEQQPIAREGLLIDLPAEEMQVPDRVECPSLPALNQRGVKKRHLGGEDLRHGFSIEVSATLNSLEAGQVLLDNRSSNGQGFCLQTSVRGTVEIVMNDGRTENRWSCDTNILTTGKRQHVVLTVDGGPKIITFIVNGRLCDGGDTRQFGWGRFSPDLRGVNAEAELLIGANLQGSIHQVRIYGRALRTSEAVGNFRAQH